MFKELSKGFMLIKISKTDFLFYIFNYIILYIFFLFDELFEIEY